MVCRRRAPVGRIHKRGTGNRKSMPATRRIISSKWQETGGLLVVVSPTYSLPSSSTSVLPRSSESFQQPFSSTSVLPRFNNYVVDFDSVNSSSAQNTVVFDENAFNTTKTRRLDQVPQFVRQSPGLLALLWNPWSLGAILLNRLLLFNWRWPIPKSDTSREPPCGRRMKIKRWLSIGNKFVSWCKLLLLKSNKEDM